MNYKAAMVKADAFNAALDEAALDMSWPTYVARRTAGIVFEEMWEVNFPEDIEFIPRFDSMFRPESEEPGAPWKFRENLAASGWEQFAQTQAETRARWLAAMSDSGDPKAGLMAWENDNPVREMKRRKGGEKKLNLRAEGYRPGLWNEEAFASAMLVFGDNVAEAWRLLKFAVDSWRAASIQATFAGLTEALPFEEAHEIWAGWETNYGVMVARITTAKSVVFNELEHPEYGNMRFAWKPFRSGTLTAKFGVA